MTKYIDLATGIRGATNDMRFASETVHTERWQGVDISKRREAAMREVRYFHMDVPMRSEELDYYRQQVSPNLPWADNHFLERVCGEPLNPGVEWANWPWGKSAANFRDDHGQFNHNYMERYWPRLAGKTDKGELRGTKYDADRVAEVTGLSPGAAEAMAKAQRDLDEHSGIRYRYGDLNDLVEQLLLEPLTRQAYLPIFFPEDTGMANPDRKPCTLGYLFLMRNNRLDITYYIRSCDFFRHFRDDIYLTVRLLLWVLDRLREKDDRWKSVTPGRFRMDIGSLHLFVNDYITLFGKPPS